MKFDKFSEAIDDIMKHCHNLLIVKGKEYTRNDNSMHNFDRGVEIEGKTREEVIWGMALKHFISIQDIRSDIAEGILPTRAMLDEKYGDLINYLMIERASIIDKLEKM